MAKPRPRGRDEVVDALLESARRLIAARGPSVSLRDIAEDAGVSFGLVHHYLGTKEQLVDEVYAKAARGAADRLAEVEHVDEALQLLLALGDGTTARLIGWAALEGRGASAGFADSPTLDLLARYLAADAAASGSRIGDADARVFAAFAMVVAIGWRLFGGTALVAAGLDGRRPEAFLPQVLDYLQRLAGTLVADAPEATPAKPKRSRSTPTTNVARSR